MNPAQSGVSNRGLDHMIYLDHHLLSDARHLINGVNVHRLKEMIFAYEQAVDRYNRQWPGHEIYRIQSEARLRLQVRQRQEEEIQRRTLLATQRAWKAVIESDALAQRYDRLEKKLSDWTKAVNEAKRIA